MLTLSGRPHEGDAVRRQICLSDILLYDDGICTRRDKSPCKNTRGGSRLQFHRWGPGRNPLANSKRPGQVRSAQGIAIHRAVIKGRHIALVGDRLANHAAQTINNRETLCRGWRRHYAKNMIERLLEG